MLPRKKKKRNYTIGQNYLQQKIGKKLTIQSEEGLEEGRKEGKQLFLQCIRLKKQGFSKEKIAEECQVDISEVEEILKEIEDL